MFKEQALFFLLSNMLKSNVIYEVPTFVVTQPSSFFN